MRLSICKKKQKKIKFFFFFFRMETWSLILNYVFLLNLKKKIIIIHLLAKIQKILYGCIDKKKYTK